MTLPPAPVDTHQWDGTRNLPAWLDRHHHWDGQLVIHTLDGHAHPQPGWTLIHWTDDTVTIASPRIAAREYGADGVWARAARAEQMTARVRRLHQPVGVVAAAEHGEPPDCAAGCGDWPCATYNAVTETDATTKEQCP
jgi:hypothetical protein